MSMANFYHERASAFTMNPALKIVIWALERSSSCSSSLLFSKSCSAEHWFFSYSNRVTLCVFLWTADKAKELAGKVGGKAITLAELDDFHPEDGMILANTTSVGMKPKTDATPVSKARPSFLFFNRKRSHSMLLVNCCEVARSWCTNLLAFAALAIDK